MGYVLTGVVLFAIAFTGWGFFHVRQELGPGYRPSRAVRRVRPIAAGDSCPCGVGTVGPTASAAGERLACTNCDRLWTPEGVKLVRRRLSGARRSASQTPDPENTP